VTVYALAKSRLTLTLLTAVALTAPLVVSGSTAPKAHAESGRRICHYVWQQGMGNPEGRTVSFVVDYKKDGACPDVDPHKVNLPADVGSWMPSPDAWEHAPVPKMTCEELQNLLTLPFSGDGGDPCTYMVDDLFYAVTSSLPGDTDRTKRFWGLASVWDLGY
jgi:hypothetical protein